MNIQVLLEKYFDVAFAAPNGVKRLRELILSLAMQGKLVAQDPHDVPASMLLKEIETEKNRLMKDGKIKLSKPLPEIKPDEVPYNLPKSWEWVRLGQIANYNGRLNINPEEIKSETWLLDLEDIEKDTSRIIYKAKYSERQSKSTKSTFLMGDVLYGKLRPYLNKVVVADTDGVCTTEIVPIVLFGNIDSHFFKWALKRSAFLDYVNSLMYGVKMPRLGTEQAIISVHPLPPFAEQRRIVAKINELMARCDELEKLRENLNQKQITVHKSALNRLLTANDQSDFNTAWQFITQHFGELYSVKENVAELRKAILQLAVMGKLVPQDPIDRPASELLKEIEKEKQRLLKDKKIKPQKELPEFNLMEVPYQVPDSWSWCYLDDLCTLITDGTHHTPTYIDNGIPFISVKNVSSGKIDFSTTRFISEEEHYELIKRCHPEIGDVLLTKVGTTGIAVPINTTDNFSIFVSVALLKIVKDLIDQNYVVRLINSPLVKKYSSDGTEGVGNKNLVLRKIKSFLVPLPPLAEQQRIVAKCDQLMALCDNLEKQIDETNSKKTNLLNAVMTKV